MSVLRPHPVQWEFMELADKIVSTRSRTHWKDAAGVVHLGNRSPFLDKCPTECGLPMGAECYIPRHWTPDYEMEVTCRECLRHAPPLVTFEAVRQALVRATPENVSVDGLRVLLGWLWLKKLDKMTAEEIYRWMCGGGNG